MSIVRCSKLTSSRRSVPVVEFLDRNASAGAQMADAAVMYIAERERIDTVFTPDRRDFSIYRTADGCALEIVPKA